MVIPAEFKRTIATAVPPMAQCIANKPNALKDGLCQKLFDILEDRDEKLDRRGTWI
jgi:hypothetical protein